MNFDLPLVLGSGSPRRQQIMSEAGFEFETRVIPVEEIIPNQIPAKDAALYLAKLKSKAHVKHSSEEILITADTVVIKDNTLLGKPKDREEAISMLNKLSGTSHQVITGVFIRNGDKTKGFSVSTTVEFGGLSSKEVEYYVDTYSPFDKAGAYGIQEWIGQIGIKSINGSYYNVVGLPIYELYQALKTYSV